MRLYAGFFLSFFLFFTSQAIADSLMYIDDGGNIHFAENIGQVPMKYRSQLAAKPTPVDAKTRKKIESERKKFLREEESRKKKLEREEKKRQQREEKEREKQMKLQLQQQKKAQLLGNAAPPPPRPSPPPAR